MAISDLSTHEIQKAKSAPSSRTRSLFNLTYLIPACLVVIAMVVTARWYQTWAGWDFGMDSTSPEFQQYWMVPFYIQMGGFPFVLLAVSSYIWFTRDRNLNEIKPREELRRYMFLVCWFFLYAMVFAFTGSFFAEQDAAWHQVVVRDTSFTPSHIVLFYGWIPFYIIIGSATFLYAITRLPLYSKGFSIPLVTTIVGPLMIFPTVGFNEWGHAFWFMEEYFTAPLHWGFVFFGWAILGLGGVLVQVVSRLVVLMGQVLDTKASG